MDLEAHFYHTKIINIFHKEQKPSRKNVILQVVKKIKHKISQLFSWMTNDEQSDIFSISNSVPGN